MKKMKKWILLVIVLTIGLNVLNAQTFSQGEKAIAAKVSNLDLDFTKLKGEDIQTDFELGLMGDYFLIDNLTLTAGFYYSHNKGDNSMLGEIGCKYYFGDCFYGGIFYQGLYDYKRLNSRGKIEVGATYYIADNVFIQPAFYFLQGEYALGVNNTKMHSKFGLSVSFGLNF